MPSWKRTGLSSFVKTLSRGSKRFFDQAVLLYLKADWAEASGALPPWT
jgi:hypothetical protein